MLKSILLLSLMLIFVFADNCTDLKRKIQELEFRISELQQQNVALVERMVLHENYLKTNAGMHEKVDEVIAKERIRQRKLLHEEADGDENGPKEIFLYCANNPQVTISDLSETQRDQDECLVLTIGSPDINSRLVLYCDGNRTMEYDEI